MSTQRGRGMSKLSELSCGHSCVIAKPTGMATNGGCHCLIELRRIDLEGARRVQQALLLYRGELAKSKANEAKLREALKDAADAFRFEGDHGTADRYYRILEETK